MILYLLVAVVPLVVGAFYTEKRAITPADEKYNKRRRFRWLLMASMPMFLLIALRNGAVGPDTGIYQVYFREAIDKSWPEMFELTRMEYGFIIFTKLMTFVTKDVLLFQVICTIIYWLAISDFINQLEKGHFFCLYLFATIGLYIFMFTGLRQCLAMCLCLFSFRFIKKRKIAIIMFIAFYFHKSSILFVLAYILYGVNFNIITIFAYLVGTAFAFLNIDSIQNWLNEQLDYEYELEYTGNGYISLIIIACVTLFSLFLLLNKKSSTKYAFSLFNISVVTMVCWILRLATRVAERPSYYFMFFSIAVLAHAIQQLGNTKERTIIKGAIVGAFFLFYFYKISHTATMVPYQFFW